MSKHPEWALKYKRKGTELRLINGTYYLYEITSKWNPEKKRPQKITLGILGKISKEHGFIESEKRKLKRAKSISGDISVKEYGLSTFISNNFAPYINSLKTHFPEHWKFILASAYAKLAYKSPMKNYQYHFKKSFLSESYSSVGLSSGSISKKIRELGRSRAQILDFFKTSKLGDNNILFDGTDLLSNSKKMRFPHKSKTKKGTFDKIVNLMFVFSINLKQPVYYRILSGNIKGVSSFRLCLDESGISDAVVIADKGFYSEANIEKLDKEKPNYIVPLKRNSALVDYSKIEKGDLKDFDDYFLYEKKVIWYSQSQVNGKQIILYKNDELKTEEVNDCLRRCKTLPEKYNTEAFYEKQHKFGTIAFITNIKEQQTPEQIYQTYKKRNQIEVMTDAFKNLLQADKSYMQDDDAIEGWMFINYIAMLWYYELLNHLQKHELNSKYAPQDLIQFLLDIKKVKINGQWYDDNITKKNKAIFEKIKLPIT